MKPALRQRARELGFDDCRVTTAQPPESGPRLEQWLAEGRHGEMAWLAHNAHQRMDPQQVLPGARSVITLAVSYAAGPQAVGSPKSEGRRPNVEVQSPKSVAGNDEVAALALEPLTQHATRNTHFSALIARYARYRDYHDVLAGRLKSLMEFVNEFGGAGTRSLWYADTGPVLERDLAQRAGLGFIGKHTNLISRRLGNWFFICEVLTTAELEPDPPERNHCGACTRCLTACPTGALTAPFQLDARLCISYLTIELKGSIPLELRPAIGRRIYGCDDCLAVCPWNRFAQEGRLMKAQARPDLETPDLLELLALDEAGFKLRFAGTPMRRTKRRGLLRNVCVALGNLGDPEALPALEKAVHDPEPLIAEHARWAIEQIAVKTGPPSDRKL